MGYSSARLVDTTFILRNLIRVGFLGATSCVLGSWLTGCGSTDAGTACSNAADCASAGGAINASGGASPAAGGHSAGTNSGGSNSAGAAGFAVTAGAGGGQSDAGAAGTAGLANNAGSAGQGSGGSTGRAGASNGGSGGGSAGGGGMSGGGDVVGKCKDDYWAATNNGSVTRYDFSQGTSLPACANVITHKGAGKDGDWDTVEGISTGDGGYFGAMNTTDYAKGAACGACAEITYNGNKKVVITIVDECPISSNKLCVKGHIDLSRKAIRQLQSNSSLEHLGNGGDGSISWRYVTCPAAGNAKLRLHPNQTSDWQPVVVENGLYPMAKVTINGTDATRVGNSSGGNAWLANGAKLPFTVRATDINGDAIQTTFNGSSGLTDIGKQFMCSK